VLALLESDHQELRAILITGSTFVQEGKGTSETVARQRWRFDRWLTRHLHTLREDCFVNVVRWHGTAGPALVREISALVEEVSTAYDLHKATFPASRVAEDWPRYEASALAMIDRIERLPELEDTDLYPIIEQMTEQSAAA
jgi:hypothetical protein